MSIIIDHTDVSQFDNHIHLEHERKELNEIESDICLHFHKCRPIVFHPRQALGIKLLEVRKNGLYITY